MKLNVGRSQDGEAGRKMIVVELKCELRLKNADQVGLKVCLKRQLYFELFNNKNNRKVIGLKNIAG